MPTRDSNRYRGRLVFPASFTDKKVLVDNQAVKTEQESWVAIVGGIALVWVHRVSDTMVLSERTIEEHGGVHRGELAGLCPSLSE